MRRFRFLTFAALLPLVLGSCQEDGTTIVGLVDVRDFVAAVATSDDIVAQFHEGVPPQPGAGPDVTANGLSSMITGGTAIRTVEGAAEFTTLIVAVQEAEGYWELTLPAGTPLLDVLVTLAQDIPDRTFTVRYAVSGNGGVGPYFEEFVSVLAVGTGDVQVSISWDTNADVDLYVVEPSGEVIYYGHRNSGTGGELDLDSNAACAGDNIRNENITWPDDDPPHGTYTVRVNLWSECGAAATNWVVTVRRRDQPPLTLTGELLAPGVGGGQEAGTVVTTFQF